MSARRIEKGDVYWVALPHQSEIGKGITHPHVVLQDTELNQSRISTTVVCALSTNMKRAFDPGNVLLEPGEAGLEKQSIVVSLVSVVPKEALGLFVGRLGPDRIDAVFSGLRLQRELAYQNGADSRTDS